MADEERAKHSSPLPAELFFGGLMGLLYLADVINQDSPGRWDLHRGRCSCGRRAWRFIAHRRRQVGQLDGIKSSRLGEVDSSGCAGHCHSGDRRLLLWRTDQRSRHRKHLAIGQST